MRRMMRDNLRSVGLERRGEQIRFHPLRPTRAHPDVRQK